MNIIDNRFDDHFKVQSSFTYLFLYFFLQNLQYFFWTPILHPTVWLWLCPHSFFFIFVCITGKTDRKYSRREQQQFTFWWFSKPTRVNLAFIPFSSLPFPVTFCNDHSASSSIYQILFFEVYLNLHNWIEVEIQSYKGI